MKIVNFLAIFFLIVITVSCDDTIDNHDQLVMGNESGMEITYYETIVMGTYITPTVFLIDIDDNGSSDFQISCELWGSPAVGAHPKSFIKSLNQDFQLYGDYTNDTTFFNLSIIPSPYPIFTIFRYHNYNCYRIDDNDAIHGITSTFKTPPLTKGTPIKSDHFYESTQAQLIDASYSWPSQTYSESNDTIVGFKDSYNRECNNFPIGTIVYIGFKDQRRSKLGWIKFTFLSKNQFKLLETAIQN